MQTTCADITVSWHEVGRGRPLILIHGLADDHRAWRKVLPGLMLDSRVILYDFRGHGESQTGQADGSLRQLGNDLISFMDAIDLPAAVLAGFSLGGTIAMRAAIDHPKRVDGLALVATSSRVNRASADWYRERAELAERGGPELRETIDRDTEDVYHRRPEETAEGLVIRRQSTADPSGYANASRAMAALREHPLDPELERIGAPTLIVAGEQDQYCPPRAAEIIAEGIEGSSVRILPDTGHPIPVERPVETVEAIRDLCGTGISSQQR